MNNWYKYTVSEGASGPQLCDYNSGLPATYCNYYNNNCRGAVSDDCYPQHVWAQSGIARYLQSGSWGWSSYDNTHAFSVRCVTAIEY